jgi:hypothetical protein
MDHWEIIRPELRNLVKDRGLACRGVSLFQEGTKSEIQVGRGRERWLNISAGDTDIAELKGAAALWGQHMRGAELSTGNIVSFDVEPMLGMKIIPVSKVSV